MAAAPQRKRQLLSSIDFSLPRYQFWVMFSVLTTKASELGRVLHNQQVRQWQWQQRRTSSTAVLESALGQVHSDNGGAAAHATEAKVQDVTAHLEAVDELV